MSYQGCLGSLVAGGRPSKGEAKGRAEALLHEPEKEEEADICISKIPGLGERHTHGCTIFPGWLGWRRKKNFQTGHSPALWPQVGDFTFLSSSCFIDKMGIAGP